MIYQITDLYPEMICEIVRYLDDPKDYCNVQKTNRMFDVLFSREKFLKMNLYKSLEYAAFINDPELYDYIYYNRSTETLDELTEDDLIVMTGYYGMDHYDPSICESFGPICVASHHGYLDMLKHIRSHNESVYQKSLTKSCLIATLSDQLHIVIYNRENDDNKNIRWEIVFDVSCINDSLNIVKNLHSTSDIDFDLVHSYTAGDLNMNEKGVLLACQGGALNVLKYFKEDIGTRIMPRNCLEQACLGRHLDIIKYLSSFGMWDKFVIVETIELLVNINRVDVAEFLMEDICEPTRRHLVFSLLREVTRHRLPKFRHNHTQNVQTYNVPRQTYNVPR
jgi:hypothetical protein